MYRFFNVSKNLFHSIKRRKFSKISTNDSSNVTEKNYIPVAYWLFGVSGLVAGMVTIGGITRLTRSGLSMTDWKLQGSRPPFTKDEWEKEFERYKTFPEWQQRKSMTLDEFKYIYFWEYSHRMFGRFIGAAFTVPLIYFYSRNMIPKHLYSRFGLLFGLGATQGLVGWWMVKSGLDVDPNQKKEIRVSPYRLATHLAMAFTTYTTLLWTGFDVLKLSSQASNYPSYALKHGLFMKRFAIGNGLLVGTTILSGAFVAGNDAGNAYNTFPKMGDNYIPDEIYETNIKPIWRNLFENTALVQFNHRILALTTLTSISCMYFYSRFINNGSYWRLLPISTRYLYHTVIGMSTAQVLLGISTLLLYVPIPLAATHQAGSLVLLSLLTGLTHSLRTLTRPLVTNLFNKNIIQSLTK